MATVGRVIAQLSSVQQAVTVTRALTDEAFADRVRRDVDLSTASPEIAAEVWELAAELKR